MTERLTITALCALGLVSDDEVEAAVEACLADPTRHAFVFREGYRLDLRRALRQHPGADDFVNRGNAGTALKRPFVRAAILQARPARE